MKAEVYRSMYELEKSHWWFLGLHELVLATIRKNPKEKLRLLDAGCGTGGMLERLLDLGEAGGFDFRQTAIDFCRKRGLNDISKLDLNKWNPPEAEYDYIVSLDVVSDKGVKNEKNVLRKFATALKPDGRIILNLPAFPILRRSHDEAAAIRRRYKKKNLLDTLSDSGLEAERLHYRLCHLFPIAFASKFLRRHTASTKNSDIFPLPRLLNSLLLFANRIENQLIMASFPFPCGMSLFSVLRKT